MGPPQDTHAWRDLGRRSETQVRGKKNVWRVFISINPGNSLALSQRVPARGLRVLPVEHGAVMRTGDRTVGVRVHSPPL
jgi:hypothetical protein